MGQDTSRNLPDPDGLGVTAKPSASGKVPLATVLLITAHDHTLKSISMNKHQNIAVIKIFILLAMATSQFALIANAQDASRVLNVPKPGPTNDAPYAPQPILQGGIVVPLLCRPIRRN